MKADDLCAAGAIGYALRAGRSSFPIAVELINKTSTTSTGSVTVTIAVVDSNNVIVDTQRTFVDGIPAGQTTWAATEVYLSDDILPDKPLTPAVTVSCSPHDTFVRGILSGPGAAIGNSGSATLEATIPNTSSTAITKGTGVQFIAFDASGKPIGGDSTSLSVDVAPGMGIVEHVTIPIPEAAQIAAVRYYVDPE